MGRENIFKIPHKLSLAEAKVLIGKEEGQTVVIPVSIGQGGLVEDRFFQVSSEHGRSLVCKIEPICDTNNLMFIFKSAKGVLFGEVFNPSNLPNVNTPKDALLSIWPKGLGETYRYDELERYFFSSEYLRGKGLPTDWVTRVLSVDSIQLDEKRVNAKEFLLNFANNRVEWIKNLPCFAGDKIARPHVFEHVLQRYLEKMESAELFIIERFPPVETRLADIALARNIDELQMLLSSAVDWMQIQNLDFLSYKLNQIPDITREKGLIIFFTRWLPASMGMYLRELHKRQIVHGFAHEQNWMTIGALADCDSLKGLPIDGSKPSHGDYKRDVEATVYALNLLAQSPSVMQLGFVYQSEMIESFWESYVQKN